MHYIISSLVVSEGRHMKKCVHTIDSEMRDLQGRDGKSLVSIEVTLPRSQIEPKTSNEMYLQVLILKADEGAEL